MINVIWEEEGFDNLCSVLSAHVAERPEHAAVALVPEWLDRQTPDLERQVLRWPGRALRGELLVDGVTELAAEFHQIGDSTWEADVVDVGGTSVTGRWLDLDAVLTRAAFRFTPLGRFEDDGLVVDEVGRFASVDDVDCGLTRKEFRLLSMLTARPGAVISRRELCATLWTEIVPDRRLEDHVHNVRVKLGRHRGRVQTVRGFGYRFSLDTTNSKQIVCGELRIDREARLAWLEGAVLDPTPIELTLLLVLARTPGRAVSTDELWVAATGTTRNKRQLKSHIMRLRRKLGRHRTTIETVRRAYRLNCAA